MADRKNPGQFGNRADTKEQARKGGLASSGSFGGANSADPRAAGRKGAKAQPTEAKAKGGRHSHRVSRHATSGEEVAAEQPAPRE